MAAFAALACASAAAMRAPVPTMCTRAAMSSFNNFRDLGGTPCGGRSVVRPGVLFRSGSPAGVRDEDKRALESAHGTLNVIDLRRADEALEDVGDRLLAGQTQNIELLSKSVSKKRLAKYVFTSRLPTTIPLLPFWAVRYFPSKRVKNFANNIVDAGVRRFLNTIELTDIYFWMLCDQSKELRAGIDAVASSPPTLVHCAHGKDRTGVLVAVLLHICGASRETIAQDYAKSDAWGCSATGQWMMLNAMPERYRERIQEWSGAEHPDELGDEPPTAQWEQFGRWCRAEEATMVKLWDWVEAKWGSMDGYLDSIGIDAARRAEVRAVLTTDAE